MALIITKRREVLEGGFNRWRIHINGKRTKLFIERAARDTPRNWGESQSYDLCHEDYGYIADTGVAGLMQIVALIAGEVQP